VAECCLWVAGDCLMQDPAMRKCPKRGGSDASCEFERAIKLG
jgi:hypothetical protein